MNRFHEDWTNGKIKKEKVLIVKFDFMMSDFENLMEGILVFLKIEKNSDLARSIKATAKDQRAFKSKHQYDLNRFGLTEKEIYLYKERETAGNTANHREVEITKFCISRTVLNKHFVRRILR